MSQYTHGLRMSHFTVQSMLQGVQRALLPAASAATSGHVTLLKQKALTAILRRLDALLFGKLLGGVLSSADCS